MFAITWDSRLNGAIFWFWFDWIKRVKEHKQILKQKSIQHTSPLSSSSSFFFNWRDFSFSRHFDARFSTAAWSWTTFATIISQPLNILLCCQFYFFTSLARFFPSLLVDLLNVSGYNLKRTPTFYNCNKNKNKKRWRKKRRKLNCAIELCSIFFIHSIATISASRRSQTKLHVFPVRKKPRSDWIKRQTTRSSKRVKWNQNIRQKNQNCLFNTFQT